MFNLREFSKKINIRGDLLAGESMSQHTTFRTGGPADLLAFPLDVFEAALLLRTAREDGIPVFITGGGANILVSDRGIRGLVISTRRMTRYSLKGTVLKASSGLSASTAAWETGAAGLEGLETFYTMPGTLGGALWMNARCYGKSISEKLETVTLLSPEGEITEFQARDELFSYKTSPFQKMDSIIIQGVFNLRKGNSRELVGRMREYESDRRKKGHFKSPSAGSVFKNNREFGKPSGMIVEEAGLKGFEKGGAMVSPDHGNIIFNTGSASSEDIRKLILYVKEEVFRKTGFLLVEEVLYAGDWD